MKEFFSKRRWPQMVFLILAPYFTVRLLTLLVADTHPDRAWVLWMCHALIVSCCVFAIALDEYLLRKRA